MRFRVSCAALEVINLSKHYMKIYRSNRPQLIVFPMSYNAIRNMHIKESENDIIHVILIWIRIY